MLNEIWNYEYKYEWIKKIMMAGMKTFSNSLNDSCDYILTHTEITFLRLSRQITNVKCLV